MSQFTPWFTPLKRSPKHKRIVSFDCEGTGDAGFVCGALFGDDGEGFFASRDGLRQSLFGRDTRSCLIVAHNLEYDLSLLCNGDFSDLSLLYYDSRLLRATRRDDHGHVWTLIDSRNLFPGFTVEALGKMLTLPKLETTPQVMATLRHGTPYHTLDMFTQQEVRRYNVRDAEIVYWSVMWLQTLLNELGGELHDTIAGCAMDVFRRKYLTDKWKTPIKEVNDFVRQAYYGSRTEPFVTGHVHDLNVYDVNSLYPSVQATLSFPHPDTFDIAHGRDAERLIERREGIAHVTVDVPDMHLPPLPVRVGERLFFPTGRLTGCWTTLELRYALSCGCTLHGVDYAFCSGRSFNPFAVFMTDLFERRAVYKRDGNYAADVIKLLLNSSYGRYGLRTDAGLQVLEPITPDTDFDAYLGAEIKLYGDRAYLLASIGTTSQPIYACTAMAAYVAAGARIRLHRFLSLSGDSTCYCDTDSVMTTRSLPHGDGLGELRLEHERIRVDIIGPKEYALNLCPNTVYHVKGIPVDKRAEYLRQGHVVFDRPLGIKEAVQKARVAGSWVPQARRRHNVAPKREPSGPWSEQQTATGSVPWPVEYLSSPEFARLYGPD